jgi:hypothetical protein
MEQRKRIGGVREEYSLGLDLGGSKTADVWIASGCCASLRPRR